MRIDLPLCNFKNCRYCFDGNCIEPNKGERCEYDNLRSANVLPAAQRMVFDRQWAMPNSKTFQIAPIRSLITKYKQICASSGTEIEKLLVIDPFANDSKEANVTNDLDAQFDTTYHLDALDFLKQFSDSSVDLILYDPPYSPRQVSECYKKLGKTVNTQTTQNTYWSNQKAEMSRIVKKGGFVISCGWNSGGVGKKNGFEIEEILLVPHGGNHNDTIVVVDRKV